jgi:predicted transposase YbfD/YdcC
VREHWRVKNNLHWRLDVIFDQDANSIRKGSSKRIRAIMTAQ